MVPDNSPIIPIRQPPNLDFVHISSPGDVRIRICVHSDDTASAAGWGHTREVYHTHKDYNNHMGGAYCVNSKIENR